jgi:hypothetical protein
MAASAATSMATVAAPRGLDTSCQRLTELSSSCNCCVWGGGRRKLEGAFEKEEEKKKTM